MPILHRQKCLCQYLSHRAAQPPFTIAQLISPDRGEIHQAPVLSPPAPPVDAQRIVGPSMRIWPCGPTPVFLPNRSARASRESFGSAVGQGWPGEQVPSSSRAAIPDNRIRGPSAHQTGPSPSQTCVGVQSKDWPAGITAIWDKSRTENGIVHQIHSLSNFYKGQLDDYQHRPRQGMDQLFMR